MFDRVDIKGRRCAFRLGDDKIVGQLPRVGDRGRLYRAYRRAMGWTEADDEAIAACGDDVERIAEVLKTVPTGQVEHDDVGSLAAAAIGLCWPSPGLGLPSPRQLRWDLVEYGEIVLDVLATDRGYGVNDLAITGAQLLVALEHSIPTGKGVEEATDFFGRTDTAGSSTS